MALAPLTLVDRHLTPASNEAKQLPWTGRAEPYLTGLRGILALQSLLWIYLSTFIPGVASPGADAPRYQRLLRYVFSVPLWNSSLISSFFIVLSMRAICIRFLRNPTSESYGGTIIRRIVRMTLLLSCASGLAMLILSQIGTAHIDEFKMALPNKTLLTTGTPHDGLAALNSIFDLFWLTRGFASQAGNVFWPSATLWVSSVVYYQGWTVYILMVVLPFTRASGHLPGLALFALGSFWYASWGWYSATGLMLADMAANPAVSSKLRPGVRIKGDLRIPLWAIAAVAVMVGLALKYAFVILPQYENSLLVLHPFLDLSETTDKTQYVAEGPYPRLDDWLVVTGILGLVETVPKAQSVLSNGALTLLGERAFSKSLSLCWLSRLQLKVRQVSSLLNVLFSGRVASSSGYSYTAKASTQLARRRRIQWFLSPVCQLL